MLSTTPSRVVRSELNLAIPPLLRAYRQLADEPRLSTLYAEYLFLLHSVIRASVPLMEDAVERLALRASEDETAAMLKRYLEDHIPEERFHDEWLLDDLAELGFGREHVMARAPSPTAAAMVGSQYYWIRHHRPVALLGYIAVLESYPPTEDEIESLAGRSRLPRAAFRTMEVHARFDPGHQDELFSVIDAMPLTEHDVHAICVSGAATIGFGITALEEILEFAPR